jgi:hypothetical protein
MHPRVIAYNFLANKLGWPQKNTLEEVMSDKDRNKVPMVRYQTYLLESLDLVSTVYQFFGHKYSVKVVQGKVTEFYIKNPEGVTKDNITYVAYDIETDKPTEYYREDNDTETKYDFETDEVKQVNYFTKYANLPEDVKNLLTSFKYKNYVHIYAEKPYGRIVECAYNR